MTSSQTRYSLAAPAAQESLFIADEWRILAESALRTQPKRDFSKAVLRVGIGMVLGTGAVSPVFPAAVPSSAPAFIVSGHPRNASKRFEVRSPAEQIISIKSLLGLNILELAAVLRVQRPTVYSWQSGTASPHHDNVLRLAHIHELALRWGRLCSEPLGEWVRKPLDESGRSIVTLLSAESIHEPTIVSAFESLKPKVEDEAKDFIGIRERARRFGYKERSEAKRTSSLDRETLV